MNDNLIKNIIESLPLPTIYIVNDVLIMNSAAERLIGYKNEEINCKEAWKKILVLPPDDIIVSPHLRNNKVKAGIRQKDNTTRKIEFTIQSYAGMESWALYPSGEDTFLENNLKDRDKILSVIYDSTSDLMVLLNVDNDGGFTYLSVNNTFINITGFTKDKFIGKRVGESFDQNIFSRFNNSLQEVVLTKEKVKTEFSYVINNNKFFFDASLKPILDLDNRCIYIFVVARDLTERKKREDELLKTKILAEESNRLKTALLSNLSHEFRTPLNGILGFADLLREELNVPEQKEMAGNIAKSGRRLFNTLNSILELSCLEAERKEIYNTSIRLYDVISEIVKKYQQEAANKGL